MLILSLIHQSSECDKSESPQQKSNVAIVVMLRKHKDGNKRERNLNKWN